MLKKCEECKRSRLELCNAGCYNKAAKNKGGLEMETEIKNAQVEPVPYIAHEAEMARIEREHDKERDQWNKEREQHKRTVRLLCSIIIVLVLALVGVFIYEAQYVDEEWTSEATTDGGGTAVANMDGEVYYYGESESDAQNQSP